jgi:hypothetical protein
MTNATHTPGPWEATVDGFIGHTCPDGDWYVIAAMSHDRAPETVNSDARLIAAAPDLLAAIKDIVAASDANDGDSLANAIQASRAAIAKAKGK